MIMRGRQRSGGFSLVELLVVLAIVAILTGISIPILRMFSQNDLDRGARSLYTLIRAARVYSSTYNVKTAVVYQLDKDPVGSPVMDSLRRQSVRVVRGAMMLYQLPEDMGSYRGLYVSAAANGGEFQPFPNGYAVLLDVPPIEYRLPPQGIAYPYGVLDPPADNANYQPAFGANIGALGMTPVVMYDGPIDPDKAVREAEYNPENKVALLAHVFDTGGKLDMGSNGTTLQRFSILFAPSPERPVDERTWTAVNTGDAMVDAWLAKSSANPAGDPVMGLIGIPIEIYRSTGRVRMGSL